MNKPFCVIRLVALPGNVTATSALDAQVSVWITVCWWQRWYVWIHAKCPFLRLTEITAWTNNYINCLTCGIITHPLPTINSCIDKWHWCVIVRPYHVRIYMHYLTCPDLNHGVTNLCLSSYLRVPQTSNISRTKSLNSNISSRLGLFCAIYWSQASCRECRCSWSSADRISNFIAY